MKQYEYKIEQIVGEWKNMFTKDKKELISNVEDKLNELGKDGWQLSGVDGTWFYFTRKLNEE